MNEFEHNFIGSGWRFPIRFAALSRTVEMLTGEEDIQNSLEILFSTVIGERVMHPDYGCPLTSFLFSPMNTGTITYMKAMISDAILFNEPRIVLNEIDIEIAADANGLLLINLQYTITATNNRYNYVYPYYLNDATNLPVHKNIAQLSL